MREVDDEARAITDLVVTGSGEEEVELCGGAERGRVTEADLPEIVDALEKGEPVQRLLLSDDDFIEPRELKKLNG